MTGEAAPTWLKVMENGSVGEARTRAFLLDRFWVLERSVDIDGTDFAIQRRELKSRFTDKSPPRLGVVQAKYYQDAATVHRIPAAYVTDDDGRPLKGFFALLHIGRDDDARMYLLSGADIVANLDLGTGDQDGKYVLGAKALVENFLVTSRKIALDRIDNELRLASRAQEDALIHRWRLPYRQPRIDDLDHPWSIPLHGFHGDVARMLFDFKDRLSSMHTDMELAAEAIDAILASTDPEQALVLWRELAGEHGDGAGGLGFRPPGDPRDTFWDPTEYNDCLAEHQAMLKSLDSQGRLGDYCADCEAVAARIGPAVDAALAAAPPAAALVAVLDLDRARRRLRKAVVGEPGTPAVEAAVRDGGVLVEATLQRRDGGGRAGALVSRELRSRVARVLFDLMKPDNWTYDG